MGVHANLLIACTQVAGETGLTGIVIFLTEIEPQHGTYQQVATFISSKFRMIRCHYLVLGCFFYRRELSQVAKNAL